MSKKEKYVDKSWEKEEKEYKIQRKRGENGNKEIERKNNKKIREKGKTEIRGGD